MADFSQIIYAAISHKIDHQMPGVYRSLDVCLDGPYDQLRSSLRIVKPLNPIRCPKEIVNLHARRPYLGQKLTHSILAFA